MQAVSKNTKVKSALITDIDMLLMVKRISEEEYVRFFIDMQKLMANT